ncbi:MAG TPA: PP2C family protein-serine/threonine phosphatase [Dongiaceae bacterium]|nr:PP2C family protein-serine/threonine phosphatase [Dongiaceae bacterium]
MVDGVLVGSASREAREPLTPGVEDERRAVWGSAIAPAWRPVLVSALVVAAFALDVVSGDEVSASLFYLVAIVVGAWVFGRTGGVLTAGTSTLAWLIAYRVAGAPFSRPAILYWNLTAELAVYVGAALTMAQVRAGLERQRLLLARLEHSRRMLDREMLAVGELQRELLPRRAPAVPGHEWAIHYETSSRAGGDYYDFFEVADGRTGVLLADASGHGAPAAVLMAMTRVLLHATSAPLAPPAAALAWLASRLAHELPDRWFVTACYLVIEPGTGRFDYSLAGHDPPMIARARTGRIERLAPEGGPPLGPFPTYRYDGGAGRLEPGDTLVLYTDGLPEAIGPGQELFGPERIEEALTGAARASVQEMRERLLARVAAHRSGLAPSDDLTLILLRRHGS